MITLGVLFIGYGLIDSAHFDFFVGGIMLVIFGIIQWLEGENE